MVDDRAPFFSKCDVESKCSIHAIKERTLVGIFHKYIYRHCNVDSLALDLSVDHCHFHMCSPLRNRSPRGQDNGQSQDEIKLANGYLTIFLQSRQEIRFIWQKNQQLLLTSTAEATYTMDTILPKHSTNHKNVYTFLPIFFLRGCLLCNLIKSPNTILLVKSCLLLDGRFQAHSLH
jgi:hypothetical protein